MKLAPLGVGNSCLYVVSGSWRDLQSCISDTNGSTPFFMHIGHEIETELHRQERTVAWFARKLCCNRRNIYKIFGRESIDTELLRRISVVLNHDFFDLLSRDLNQPKV